MSKTYKVIIQQKPTPSTKHSMLKTGDSITISDTGVVLPFQTLPKSGAVYESSLYTLTFNPGGISTLECHPGHPGQEDPESTETFTTSDGGPGGDTGPIRRLLRGLWRALMRLFRR